MIIGFDKGLCGVAGTIGFPSCSAIVILFVGGSPWNTKVKGECREE